MPRGKAITVRRTKHLRPRQLEMFIHDPVTNEAIDYLEYAERLERGERIGDSLPAATNIGGDPVVRRKAQSRLGIVKCIEQ